MAASLQDLYEAYNSGASRTTLLGLIEELDRNHVPIPASLRQEIVELAEIDDDQEE